MTIDDDGLVHRPVLYHEIIHALQPKEKGLYVDCTLGAGGHAWGILDASSPSGKLLGFEVDPQVLIIAKERLAIFGSRAIIVQASYITLMQQLLSVGWAKVDGIILDLGVSSLQLDTPERGFSFRYDAPLDMRFDPSNPVTAEDIVNSFSEKELADLLYHYGEEKKSRQIARLLIASRPISSTGRLAELVTRALGKTKRSSHGTSIHPATRTFQALRIAVNKELDALETVLPQAVSALATGGRLAVISFHSLEDRIVKDFFRRESKDCICPPKQPQCTCDHHAQITEITRHPIIPTLEEKKKFPRSRSAKLRVAQKLDQ
jgi:16S rRNA (cytosine1402-N4)-methyltransferase